jgi:hypothetical protein
LERRSKIILSNNYTHLTQHSSRVRLSVEPGHSRMSLENSRVRFAVVILVGAFGFVVTFLTISISFGVGFQTTLLLAVIIGLIGWIIADQVVRRRLPKLSPQPQGAGPGASGLGCLDCGRVEVLAPPDSVYIWPKLDPCERGDSKPMRWVCRQCSKDNVTYWDRYHPPY